MGEAKIVQQHQCIVQVVVSKPIWHLKWGQSYYFGLVGTHGNDISTNLRVVDFYCTHAVGVITKAVYYKNSRPHIHTWDYYVIYDIHV